VYGGTLEDAKEHAREEMDKGVIADQIAQAIVGFEYVVRGSLSVDEYGANLDATSFTRRKDDPKDRAQTLVSEGEL